VSWKSPGNLLGWICRHPVSPYCANLLSFWLLWLQTGNFGEFGGGGGGGGGGAGGHRSNLEVSTVCVCCGHDRSLYQMLTSLNNSLLFVNDISPPPSDVVLSSLFLIQLICGCCILVFLLPLMLPTALLIFRFVSVVLKYIFIICRHRSYHI